MKGFYEAAVLLPCIFGQLAAGAPVEEQGDSSALTSPNKARKIAEIRIGDSTRRVAYFLDSPQNAIIDGDVRIGTEQELLAGQTTLKARAHSLHPDVNDNAFGQELWPEAKVLYAYKDQATKNKVQASVNGAIKQWNMYADHINFVDQGFGSADKVGILTITANASGGCYSNIGYHKGATMYMNLVSYNGGVCSMGATTHEFGHAIGLLHEHQRPDREKYVHFVKANVEPHCPKDVMMPDGVDCASTSGIPDGCCNDVDAFGTMGIYDHVGPYDVDSLMHYSGEAFGKKYKATLVGVGSVYLPNTKAYAIKKGDADRVCKLYGDQCGRAVDCRIVHHCPANCTPRPTCPAGTDCSGTFKPTCCLGPAVDPCVLKQKECTDQGCDFLYEH